MVPRVLVSAEEEKEENEDQELPEEVEVNSKSQENGDDSSKPEDEAKKEEPEVKTQVNDNYSELADQQLDDIDALGEEGVDEDFSGNESEESQVGVTPGVTNDNVEDKVVKENENEDEEIKKNDENPEIEEIPENEVNQEVEENKPEIDDNLESTEV